MGLREISFKEQFVQREVGSTRNMFNEKYVPQKVSFLACRAVASEVPDCLNRVNCFNRYRIDKERLIEGLSI